VSRIKPGTIGVREQGKIDKERRIKAAAHAEFRENGYVGATMRSIAARAEVATGTLFLYAPDKRNLLLWILNDDLDELTDKAFADLPPGGGLLAQLSALFTPRYVYWGADPDLAAAALGEVMQMRSAEDQGDSQISHYHRRRASLIARISHLIAEHQQAGDVRRDHHGDLSRRGPSVAARTGAASGRRNRCPHDALARGAERRLSEALTPGYMSRNGTTSMLPAEAVGSAWTDATAASSVGNSST
jgi:AcrR family transcriptional regulator